MLFATIGQPLIFLWMLGAGLMIGAVYALFRGLRRLFAAGRALTLFMDALFGLCAALIFIAASVFADYGRVRLYQFAAAALGAILYRQGIDLPLQTAARAAGKKLRRLCFYLSKTRLIKVIFK